MNETLEFKSVPENFAKERDGLKPNTERTVSTDDPRYNALNQRTASRIRIVNAENRMEFFERVITDISFWDGRFTISWRHVEMPETTHRSIAADPDSIEVGTPSKGGAVKIYGDFSRPESFKRKIKAAKDVRETANKELGASV
jgi:hypothetical protein